MELPDKSLQKKSEMLRFLKKLIFKLHDYDSWPLDHNIPPWNKSHFIIKKLNLA